MSSKWLHRARGVFESHLWPFFIPEGVELRQILNVSARKLEAARQLDACLREFTESPEQCGEYIDVAMAAGDALYDELERVTDPQAV